MGLGLGLGLCPSLGPLGPRPLYHRGRAPVRRGSSPRAPFGLQFPPPRRSGTTASAAHSHVSESLRRTHPALTGHAILGPPKPRLWAPSARRRPRAIRLSGRLRRSRPLFPVLKNRGKRHEVSPCRTPWSRRPLERRGNGGERRRGGSDCLLSPAKGTGTPQSGKPRSEGVPDERALRSQV